jgi:hypothetical protein
MAQYFPLTPDCFARETQGHRPLPSTEIFSLQAASLFNSSLARYQIMPAGQYPKETRTQTMSIRYTNEPCPGEPGDAACQWRCRFVACCSGSVSDAWRFSRGLDPGQGTARHTALQAVALGFQRDLHDGTL